MNDEEGLHRAVVENPYEHTLLLALADWYEENDKTGFAELIRHHVASPPMYENGKELPIVNYHPHDERGATYGVGFTTRYPLNPKSGDLIHASIPSKAHNQGNLYFSAFIPRGKSKRIFRSLANEGFKLNNSYENAELASDTTTLEYYKRRAMRFNQSRIKFLCHRLRVQRDIESTIPVDLMEIQPWRYARDDKTARREYVSIKDQPYVFVKNQFGWGVQNVHAGHGMAGRNYQVNCDEGGNPVNCSCPDNVYRRHECKHMKAVRELPAVEEKPTESTPQEEPTKQSALSRPPRKMGAYRAPAGGIVARGTAYKGGEMIPDMEGSFMNPKKLKALVVSYRAKKRAAKWTPKPKRVPYVPFGVTDTSPSMS